VTAATVLQLSDTHLTAQLGGPVNGLDPDARLEVVLAAVRRSGLRPDLVVLTGDNADDASQPACERLRHAVTTLGAPVLAVAGNHDDPAIVADVFGAGHQAEVGAWRVVTFDSSRPGQIHGTLDVPAAIARLDALDARQTVVAVHHPPRSRSTHPWFRLDGADALLEGLTARPHVRAVITGHVHDAFSFSGPGGLALLGCPSTLMAISHAGTDMEIGSKGPTGARILTLDGDDLSTELLIA